MIPAATSPPAALLAWVPSTSLWRTTCRFIQPSRTNYCGHQRHDSRYDPNGQDGGIGKVWGRRGAKRARSSASACFMNSRPNEIEDGVTFGSYLKLPSATGDTLVITDNTDKTTLVPAGDDVCFEGGCPSDLEPPHGMDPEELENPALREIRSSSAGPTVWSEFSALAAETGAINLGQGFPNWPPPEFVVEAAHESLSNGFHQYTRTAGHPRLCKLLAARYTKHFNREIDPFSQVAITIGASQALYVTFQTILSQGDEVVLLEPFFDLYLGQIKMAGGVVKPVPLAVEEGEFRLNIDAVRSVISPRTRVIVVNTPHNPTGKVFSKEELEAIAEVVRENPRILVISDEVYKYMVYAGANSDDSEEVGGYTHSNHGQQATVLPSTALPVTKKGEVNDASPLRPKRHVHFATLDGMWDRTITISSAGKTFSVTGWQVGWVLGPARVIQEIHTILPYMQFCVSTPMQEAICTVLQKAEQPYGGESNYYDWLRLQYAGKRAYLESALKAAGIPTLKGEGGFFIIGDVSRIKVPEKYTTESRPAMPIMTHDWAFCRWMALEHGLVAIPTSPFFSAASRAEGLGSGLVRFCFCKKDETIEAAARALANMARQQALGVSRESRVGAVAE